MSKSIYLFLAGMLAASVSFASGTEGPGSNLDHDYELGKSLLKGRTGGFEKVKYCVRKDDGATKIKSRSMKAYKGVSAVELAAAIVNCDMPEKALADYMNADAVGYVVYYLDKRYKLKTT